MPPISNLNVQIGPNQTGTGGIGTAPASPGRPVSPSPLASPRTGTVVEGQVLGRNADGTYSVRIDAQDGRPAQTLLARATLTLIAGERFRAVWDASGTDGVPVLRLSPEELSFLSRVPASDREVATALLARGLPLSDEVLAAVRDAWRRVGSAPDQLSSLIELWARGAPLTAENVRLLTEYAALGGGAATALWARIRKELRERARNGEDPVEVLRGLKEGEGELARFLRAHSLLMHTPRDEVNPLLLGAPFWPGPEDAPDLTARVFVGRVCEEDGRRYWQVGFGVEGPRLGFVGGTVESDGRGCNLDLHADRAETCELLKRRRGDVREELEGTALPVRFIGISRSVVERLRNRLLSGRGLDLTV